MKKSLLTLPLVLGIIVLISVIPVVIAQEESENKIPEWVKAIFGYYVEGLIDDTELVGAIKFLIESKIIVIEEYGKIDMPIEEEDSVRKYESPEEVNDITVQTDKDTYSIGEEITISGTVSNDSYTTISIVIVNSNNNMASIIQTTPINDKYSEKYTTNGNFGLGEFEIRVSHDGTDYTKTIYNLVE